MSVEVKVGGGNGRSRERIVKAHIYLQRWVQVEAARLTIYGENGDLNRIDVQADNLTRQLVDGSSWWYGGATPGATDEGETKPAWFGMEIRVEFRRIAPTGLWSDLYDEIEGFVLASFPNEQVEPMAKTFARPDIGDPNVNPAKFVVWTIEH